jgi:hypothetical protein
VSKPKKSTVIATVTVVESPSWVRSLPDWIEWRQLEDLRMRRDLEAQLLAHFERINGVVEH